ncbi:hypothetical protein DJ021_13585 [Phenylobacterium hankyongense]|uniref:Acyltransferase 3 domain-containing protein n=1 Tax=Phenylobacterium hankyongense TaxID=1813876 RepID=A0A328B2M3_9CAUL|nr:acyltransferase [Phenylobacterium hankyongense]RAK60765.1 hypothetical protein DJ021_13585 [Phenylobacterium hankyongense]
MHVTKRYETLDGLRGVAALAVLWLHITEVLHVEPRPVSAHLGVDFFFCLSGFVIAHAYEDRLKTVLSFGGFMRERAIRLMPLAALGAVLGGLVVLARVVIYHDAPALGVLGATALNMALLPTSALSVTNNFTFPTDPPLWSLSFEVAINVAFGLLVLRLTTPRLAAVVIGAVALTIWTAARNGGLDVGWAWPHLADGFARVLFPFAMGVLLRRLPVWRNHLALALPVVLAALLLAPNLGAMGQAAVVILAVPVIVYVGAGAAPSRADGVARWLGLMSYPIYVIHHPLLRVIQRGAEMVHIRNPAVLVAAGFIVPLIAAYLLNRFYDVPVRAWLATWTPCRRAAIRRPAT